MWKYLANYKILYGQNFHYFLFKNNLLFLTPDYHSWFCIVCNWLYELWCWKIKCFIIFWETCNMYLRNHMVRTVMVNFMCQTQVRCSCEVFLDEINIKSVDLKWGRLPSKMWVGLIQLHEGLNRTKGLACFKV